MHNSENGASAVRHRSPEVQASENKKHFLVAEKNEDLLQWKDMPKHLQFNPYIFTGYRPLLSVWGCLNSLFYLHNETINIFTHGIPIVYILLSIPDMKRWTQPDLRFLTWCHIVGSISPWVGSFVYHLFMNLERGEKIYYRLLQLDMLGIWICQCFGAMPMVIATTYCLPRLLRWFSVSSYCLFSLWGLYKAMIAISPWERRLSFLLPFCMRIVLCIFRFYNFGGGDPAARTHLILQDLISLIGGAIGAMHIPERWFPGCVDMYLNSHNIMHILVVTAVYSMHVATMGDLAWMDQVKCKTML